MQALSKKASQETTLARHLVRRFGFVLLPNREAPNHVPNNFVVKRRSSTNLVNLVPDQEVQVG